MEISFVRKKNIICGVIYRQHNTPELFQQYFDEAIEKFTASGKHIYICGDYNIDLLKVGKSSYSNDFLMSLQSCCLVPTIDKPTRVRRTSATLIDNILVNTPEQVSVSGNIISDISDHFSQFCILDSVAEITKIELKNRKVRDFSAFSTIAFTNALSEVDWNEIVYSGGNDVDGSFTTFYNKFNKIVNKHAPFKTLSNRPIKQQSKPWITKGIRASIKVKNKLYMSGNDTLYKHYRNKIAQLVRLSKKNFFFDFFNNHISNMKKTWQGINDLLKRKKQKGSTIKNLKCPNSNTTTSDESTISNILNNHFASIGSKLANKLPVSVKNFSDYLDSSKSPSSSFCFDNISANDVKLEILSMPDNKSYGFYSFPTKMLKCAAPIMADILAAIFNRSVLTGVYPSKLKMARVIPIFKADDDSDPNNYRPISLLSNINQLFEKLMYKRMKLFIEKMNILSPSQYGFRQGHSTEHAILDIINAIQSNMDRGEFSCGVFIDLKKAFDTVNHNILLEKLHFYVFRGIINDWFASYLKERTQITIVGNKSSHKSTIDCGVPQGSVLGPLLFLLYINDIGCSSKKLHFYLFADDTNILYSNKNLKSLECVMNTELCNVHQWLLSNKLSLNYKKSNFTIFRPYQKKLSFSPNISIYDSEHHQPSPLESKDFVKYLGVFIDYKLSWNHHIDTVTLKISRTIGLLSKLRHFIPPYTLLQIYNSLVAPYLCYGLIAWGQANKTLLNKLLILQKRALRFIFFSDRRKHAIPLFLSAKILPVQFMYFYDIACMMHDVSNNVVPLNIKNLFQLTSSVHRYNTRSSTSQNYYLKRSNLEIQRKSFSRIGAKLWNEIPASIRNLPKHLFKKELRSVLLKILETADDYLDIKSIISRLKKV